MPKTTFPAVAVALLIAHASHAVQSQNHGVRAVPAPKQVTIDGKLDEWDVSGRIEVFANYRMRNSYSAKVAAMYDKEHLYLSISWRDKTPMFNMIDARFDIDKGWRSDCIQLRLRTDVTMHIDCWYSTAARRPVVSIVYGRFSRGRDTQEDTELLAPITDAIKAGAKAAFQMGEDRAGYVQEIALPWKLITGRSAIVKATGKPYKPPRDGYKAGDTLKLGMEFFWGGPDGKTWPVHRYADNLAPGQSDREFFWTAERAWGPLILEPGGHLKLARADYGQVDTFGQKTQGPAPISMAMPFDGFATIVIEDEEGRRVRNLIGTAPRARGRRTEYWDGLTEEGRIAPPGRYTWRGLVHQGIDPTYAASYGTPGRPPWSNAAGSGAWMSDHNAPVALAAAAKGMVLAAGGSEAGYAIIGTDLDGRKKWSLRKFQGVDCVAADGRYMYAGMGVHRHIKRGVPTVGRAEVAGGKYAPFTTDATGPLIVPVATEDEQAVLRGIDVHGGTLAVSLAGPDVVRYFDAATMNRKGQVKVADPRGVCFDPAGVLHAISGKSVVRVVAGKHTSVVDGGIEDGCDLAIDTRGRIFVSDRARHQVKVFDKGGTFIRAIGAAGGRPKPGTWLAGAMRHPAGIDIDPRGRLWVAEADRGPKRVSVWSAEGKLVTDFIGPTVYGGMNAFVDRRDKTRVFGSGCEFKLDYGANTSTVVANPLADQFAGEFIAAGGHEYVMAKRAGLHIRRGEAFVPCVKFGGVPEATVQAVRTHNWRARRKVNFLWCDRNDDGQVQTGECIFKEIKDLHWGGGYWGGYWLDEDFNLYISPGTYGQVDIARIPRVGWSTGGVPLYDADRIETLFSRKMPGGPNVLLTATTNWAITAYTPIIGVDLKTRTLRWTYANPWAGVHGSHRAPMPASDAVAVGVLSCIGMADTPVGKVFAMNSNMGRLYVMTTDGLLLATVFQDNRTGADVWPGEAKRGAPLGGVTMGSEWFGGYFFKADTTGEYYLIAGGTSYNLIKLTGFKTVRRVEGGALEWTAGHMIAAQKLQESRAAKKAPGTGLVIRPLAKAPTLDGDVREYGDEAFVQWQAGRRRARAVVATYGNTLCLAYEVREDRNPMVNGGKDPTHLFATGDSVDLQLGTDSLADPKRRTPVAGDLRLLISVLGDKPVAVLYRWKAAPGQARPVTFHSPWRSTSVDLVKVLTDAQIRIRRRNDSYTVEAVVPLATLGFAPRAGRQYKIDLGVIYSDAAGTNRAARVYWANQATGLTSDIPGEIMGRPNLWGAATVAK